ACNCARERKQCSCPTWYVSSRLVGTLELTRRLLGVPIYVSSGFRCPERNFHVGGSPHSRRRGGEG
ncbi:MAG: hypothetical protein LBR38_08765, partial [Synergistaceae bacterium]|nr:hypothetical protein [Synergistaceae bacterium]